MLIRAYNNEKLFKIINDPKKLLSSYKFNPLLQKLDFNITYKFLDSFNY